MDKHKIIRTTVQALLFAVPFALGLIGFADQYRDFGSRLYHTMALYALNFNADEEYLQAHRYLQAARILAGAATFSVIISILNNFRTSFAAFIRIRFFGAVVVHGEGSRAERVLEGIRDNGSSAIRGNCRACFRARNQVLAFDTDGEALRYLDANLGNFFPGGNGGKGKKKIVLCSDMYSNSECKKDYFSIYNPAETCARLYWQEHWLDRERFTGQGGEDMIRRVAIIGDGRFGEHLLNQALIMNVTDRQLETTEEDGKYIGEYLDRIRSLEGVEYHVIGSGGRDYLAMHPMLGEFLNLDGEERGHRDSLRFHESLSDIGIRTLNSFDRIIIALDDPEKCLEMMNKIVCAGAAGEIHVHCADERILNSLYRTETKRLKIVPFGMNRKLYSRENILHEQMEKSAKEMNFNYVKSTAEGPVPEDGAEKLMEESWNGLTYFQKMSNFASCDHGAIKEGLLRKYPFSENADTDTANLLMEIEHTRWERFYWLHNWEYSAQRDDAGRRHPSLQPFSRLSRKDQLKDYEMYRAAAQKG